MTSSEQCVVNRNIKISAVVEVWDLANVSQLWADVTSMTTVKIEPSNRSCVVAPVLDDE